VNKDKRKKKGKEKKKQILEIHFHQQKYNKMQLILNVLDLNLNCLIFQDVKLINLNKNDNKLLKFVCLHHLVQLYEIQKLKGVYDPMKKKRKFSLNPIEKKKKYVYTLVIFVSPGTPFIFFNSALNSSPPYL